MAKQNDKKRWRHNELQADLAEHLRGSRNLIAWEDMQLGPSGSCRPDVYAIPRSFAKFRPLAYECKVSVADFRSDVTTGKWQRYLDYACGVVFAVPAGLISKEDLPPGCGLIVRHENVWRAAKGPTLQPLPTIPTNAWVKLLIDGIERESARQRVSTRVVNRSSYRNNAILRKKYGDEVAGLISSALRSKDRLKSAIERDEAKRREVQEGTEQFVKMRREEIEREMSTLGREQRDLAVMLGLEADATVRDLTSAIRKAQQRLGEDAEIQRLRNFFDSVKRLAERGLEPLPGLDQERQQGEIYGKTTGQTD